MVWPIFLIRTLNFAPADHGFLEAAVSFVEPTSLWNVPLIRIVAGGSELDEQTRRLTVRLHVYFSRLIFCKCMLYRAQGRAAQVGRCVRARVCVWEGGKVAR